MPNRLLLSELQRQTLFEAARAAWPKECCGLLVGCTAEEGGALLVERVIPSPNIAEPPESRFEIEPALRIRLEKELRGGKSRIIGHYHSHPDGPPLPSPTDALQIYEPELIWLIIGSEENGQAELAAFIPVSEGNGFTPLDLSEIA
jgi:proteasome lid subunit RPN8/RPN11